MSLEYWVHGTVRKVARVAVPTFGEAQEMLKRSDKGARAPSSFQKISDRLSQTPRQVAEVLCGLRSISSDHRVSLSLGELLGLRICEKWWLTLEQKKSELEALRQMETWIAMTGKRRQKTKTTLK